MPVPYELRRLELPRLTGLALSGVAAALEHGPTRAALLPRMLREGGFEKLRAINPGVAPLPYPRWAGVEAGPPAEDVVTHAAAGVSPPGLEDAAALAEAFASGALTPSDVAERALAWLEADEASDTPLNAFIRRNPGEIRALAEAASERWRAGRPLGPLDGVPVAVKDELDQRGYPTTVGTRFIDPAPAESDATLVARLRAAGAVLLGKTNLHEIGISPSGVNMTFGHVRNPHHRGHDPGGSSSGSAAAVAAGVCPLAVGADGGGSIRIPAALCGVVGLKGTYGRFSERGVFALCWSVGHVGPIGRTVRDVALGLAVMGGPDAEDPMSLAQPRLDLARPPSVEGTRVGVYRRWFEHASPAAVAAARAGVAALEAAGARVVEIEIPELDEARVAHAATILSEMATAMNAYGAQTRQLAPSSRISVALGRAVSAVEYLQAQRIRARCFEHFEAALREVDVIATPTTGLAAPEIPVRTDREAWSDLSLVTELMRFVFPSNLTGHPALTVPVGEDRGLPLGLQLIGRAWDETRLLELGATVEAAHPPRRPGDAAQLL